jgi:hypothetical protein
MFRVVIAAAMLIAITSCDSGTGSEVLPTQNTGSEVSPTENKTIEYQLAVVDAGGYVPDNDISVARFRSLLEQLSQAYGGSDQQIADQTVKAQELLKNRGVKESLLNIMTGMNKLFPIAKHNQHYAEVLALYIGLRDKGESNEDAVKDLQDLVQHLSGVAGAENAN